MKWNAVGGIQAFRVTSTVLGVGGHRGSGPWPDPTEALLEVTRGLRSYQGAGRALIEVHQLLL